MVGIQKNKYLNQAVIHNMLARLALVSLLVFTSFYHLSAQISQPHRLEREIKDNEDYFNLISAEDMGLMLYRESADKGSKGMKKWEFSSIDTALNTRWNKFYDIDFEFHLLGYAYSDKKVYLLFRDGYSIKDDFVIVKMDVLTGDTLHFPVRKLVPLNLTHFEVVGNTALIGGMINYRPTIVHHTLSTGKSKVIPGIYRGESEILELKVDPKTKTFNVLITEKTFDKRLTITLMSFDESGVLLQNTKLEPENDKSLIFAGSTPFKDNEIMVTGTYSHKRSTYSRGIFIAKIDEIGNQHIDYYSYADLDNFFNYMTVRHEARVKRRIERKKIKGKKAKFTYRLLVRDVIEKDGSYVMIGEAFYPRYNNGSYYGGFGDPFSPFRNTNFLGYKFTHAVVVGFNSQGEILWNNSFEINDVESYDLDEVVSVGVEGDKVILLYLYDGVIRSKIIENEEVVEGKSSDDIKLNNENDVVKHNKDEYGGVDNWYDNFFYAYGIQKIKSKDSNASAPTREVFFINKITYQ